MILKSFELDKINLKRNKIILFYGKNEGHKNEAISALTKKIENILIYEENEILESSFEFLESLFTKSLFENEKFIVIKRASEKILKILNEIKDKPLNDITILINSEALEKKSKLRNFFEKSKLYTCVAFYPDNHQNMLKFANNYLKIKKFTISQENLNLIINKCNEDREKLIHELNKLYFFSINGKKINSEVIEKLTNLTENHNISLLIDNCLAKNKSKTIKILNENNFSNDDCIIITRTFMNKSKKIYQLCDDFEKNKDLDLTISNAKPPIFWKDKEITKQQIYKWRPEKIKNLIYKINELELTIKKNINNSINIVTDFILEQAS